MHISFTFIIRYTDFISNKIYNFKMRLILYMAEYSPAVRAVQITANILSIELELKKINLSKREQYSPEYSQINPAHSVPTLIDGETIICDSHAINIYLVRKYGKNDTLYPNDFARRALVDEKLFFEAAVLFPYLKIIVKEKILNKIDTIPSNIIADVIEAYSCLEKFLERNDWIAGDCITLADISLLPTVSSSDVLIPIDVRKYPKLKAWMLRAQASQEFKIDEQGLEAFKILVKKLFSPF